MSKDEAIRRADQNLKAGKSRTLVVYESHEYHVADEEDLETFWLGAPVVYDAEDNA